MNNQANIESLLDELYDIIDKGWSLPLSGGKVFVDGDEARQILDEVRDQIPDEIRKAQVEEVLNMPHVKAFLKRNAEATGLTEKEVFDRMMEIIEKEPERVEQWFKDQDEKIDGLFPNLNDKK